jgi:hypothetical protein
MNDKIEIVGYIARDHLLCIYYPNKPHIIDAQGEFMWCETNFIELPDSMYPEVKKLEAPVKVKLTIEKLPND